MIEQALIEEWTAYRQANARAASARADGDEARNLTETNAAGKHLETVRRLLAADDGAAADALSVDDTAPPSDPLAAALNDAELLARAKAGDVAAVLRAAMPPTDADALLTVLRVADENAEADPGDHEAATREVERLARAAHAAERDALVAVARGERLDGDTQASLAKPLTDARAQIKATDAAGKQVARARPGQARRAVPVTAIEGKRPEPLLSIADHGGALLSVGGVLVLAGEGGVAKTPLALSVALGVAAQRLLFGDLSGGLFAGAGGPVLIASYEDWPTVTADRLRKLAATWQDAAAADRALPRVHILEMSGRPLFGPAPRGDGDAGFYNARPEPLAGWADLWNEAKRTGARLIVVDPALSAFVGQSNDAAPVREFLTALAGEAAQHGAGVLLIAHSNKTARSGSKAEYDPFDPGHVGGSGHWTDTARGAMSLTYDRRDGAAPGARILAVSKANYGPARRWCKVVSHTAPSGEIVGFGIDGAWKPATDFERDKAPRGDKNGTGKVDPTERAALDAL